MPINKKKPYCTKNIEGVDFDVYVSKVTFSESNMYLMPNFTEITFREKKTKYFVAGFLCTGHPSKKELAKVIEHKVKLFSMFPDSILRVSNNKK